MFDGGGGGGGGKGAGSAGATTAKAATTVTLTAGDTKVQSPLIFSKFPTGVGDPVMAALGKYVTDGIVTALRTGRADDADLATAVDAGVTAQLAGADRAVLFDEGLPKATGKLAVTAPPVTLTALVGSDGNAVIVIASVQLDITATDTRGPVHITRTGNLQFAPDATGAWKLTGYDLTVNRGGKGVPVPKSGSTSGAQGASTTSSLSPVTRPTTSKPTTSKPTSSKPTTTKPTTSTKAAQ